MAHLPPRSPWSWLAGLAAGVLCSGCAVGPGRLADAPPTYESLRDFITTQHLSSVDQVVAALPAEYREHHALMFESRSLQTATFERPRAIVYGTDASFVIAFDGESAGGGPDTLETMEFDRVARRFVLREIAFEDGSGGPHATFSDENPAACATCHGAPAHPIWDSYPTWPGAYGEIEGIPPWLAPREKDGYASFLRVREEEPRYRALVDPAAGRIAEGERRYHGRGLTSANAELGMLLSRWNAEAVVHELVSAPGYPRAEQDLIGALVDACNDEVLMTAPVASSVQYSVFVNALAVADEKRQEVAARRMPRMTIPVARTSPLSLARFRYLAGAAAGIAPDRWALSLPDDGFDLPVSRNTLASVFLEQAAERDPGVREEFLAAEANGDCAAIRTRSAQAHASLR